MKKSDYIKIGYLCVFFFGFLLRNEPLLMIWAFSSAVLFGYTVYYTLRYGKMW